MNRNTEPPQLDLAVNAASPIVPVENLTRKRNRPYKHSLVLNPKRWSKREMEQWRAQYPASINSEYDRPQTRGQCAPLQPGEPFREHSQRPCPFVSCKHHLYLDIVERTGSLILNFPNLEVWNLSESCALDFADRGELTLAEVGHVISLTRERVRQIELRAMRQMRDELPESGR